MRPRGSADYVVTPDEVDAEVACIEGEADVRVDRYVQFGGRTAYAITLPCRPEGSLRLMVGRPHAHEPAGTAACFEMVRQLIDLDSENEAWRDAVRDRFTVTFMPDANPSGSQWAPVRFWNGAEIPNETFFLWMFGGSGEKNGERFPRVGCWDLREVVEPALIGIAYEQIDDYVFVEPNRDHRSTFFRSFFELDAELGYHVWLDLHRTEYLGSENNCHINMPTALNACSDVLKALYSNIGRAIITRWKDEGANPRPKPQTPYRNRSDQFEFLRKGWQGIASRLVHIVTEVQNNNVRTPVQTQVVLQLTAIDTTMRWMAVNYDALESVVEASRSS